MNFKHVKEWVQKQMQTLHEHFQQNNFNQIIEKNHILWKVLNQSHFLKILKIKFYHSKMVITLNQILFSLQYYILEYRSKALAKFDSLIAYRRRHISFLPKSTNEQIKQVISMLKRTNRVHFRVYYTQIDFLQHINDSRSMVECSELSLQLVIEQFYIRKLELLADFVEFENPYFLKLLGIYKLAIHTFHNLEPLLEGVKRHYDSFFQ